jgi:alkylated DNA nucleotide flippase Atl1
VRFRSWVVRGVIALAAAGVVAFRPAALDAWGLEVHRLITDRAIDRLPADVRPFFAADRAFVVEHAADPDLWKAMDLRGTLGVESPNHYFDIDGLGSDPPFAGVPRERRAFIDKYGSAVANRTGRLPWQMAAVYTRLVDAFGRVGRGATAATDARYLAAVLAHYVEDAYVPFHAVVNYDGQLTGQRGVHARFETALVLGHARSIAFPSVRVQPVPDITAFAFDTLVDSAALVAPVLDADRRAAAAHPKYDAAYYAMFWDGCGPILTRRLGEAASGVASAIAAAWDAAGRPDLPAARVEHVAPSLAR